MTPSKTSPNKPANVFTLNALGTTWFIERIDGKSLHASLCHDITLCIQDFEASYSRFRPDSLLSILNTTGRLDNPPAECVDMVRFALDMYAKSDGLFDISIGGVLEKQGYGLAAGSSTGRAKDLLQAIDIAPNCIRLKEPIHLDFGGFGKGWLVDRLAAFLSERGLGEYVINGGGDIAVQSYEPIAIFLEHPFDNTLTIGSVALQYGAIANSSNNKRTWKAGSATHSHIVTLNNDPESQNLASIHVQAANATLADTLATILFIAPASKRPILASRFQVSYMEIRADGTSLRSPGFDFVKA